MDRYETQIVGNGPAGISVPLRALAAGPEIFEALTKKGICLIGPKKSFGRGSLDYKIRSNSSASDFLETCPAEILELLKSEKAFLELKELGSEAACLERVADFEARVAECLEVEISQFQKNPACFDGIVKYVKEDQTGDLVTFDEADNPIAASRNLVFALGARQEAMDFGKNRKKRELSDDFLRLGSEAIKERVSGKKIMVIGGAHSAFSVIDNIRKVDREAPIKLLHRNGFKLFFASEAEAQKAGYSYNRERDVDDGKIHRFNGIRGDAQDCYNRIKNKEDLSTEAVPYNGKIKEIEDYLDEADIIIQAVGYKSRTIPVENKEGELVHQEARDVSENFSPLVIGSGKVFYNGLATTRRDGVNLFQGGFAQKILNQINAQKF